MCGIAGYVGDIDRNKLSKMLQVTRHRGPDDSGIFIHKNVGMGNNRLSVIDLSAKAHQPMFDDKREAVIVYNGEIYNFIDVKRKLGKDYKFRSNSDTEVIIYAYKKWGVNCLKYLNGMFSFVIFDIKKNLLFGARDRLGEKPLKYFWDGDNFIFASEVKAILTVLKEKPKIDIRAINDYLTFGYVPSPATGLEKIYKLPPASYFIFKDGKLSIKKYWHLDFSTKLKLSEDEWVDLLDREINESVGSRLVSDVPVGSFLSGGIDSSAVTGYMAKNSKSRIDTFSIGFTEPEFDETKYANLVAEKYHTRHHKAVMNAKLFKEILINATECYDEPFADNSLIPSIYLSRFAKKNVTVALSGDGGDENFAGYDRYNIVKFGEIYKKIPKAFQNSFIKPAADISFLLNPGLLAGRAKIFADTFNMPFYKKYIFYKSFMTNMEKHDIFLDRMLTLQDSFAHDKQYFDRNLSNLDNALKADINSYLPEDLLYKMDIASMRASLEVRSPLLDYKLMELTAKMPDDLKIRSFSKKYIFKKMLIDKNILPTEIVNRQKRGFNPPYKKWFKKNLKNFVTDSINSKKFRETEIFDNEKLNGYLERYFTSNVDYGNNIFALVSLSNWIRKYT